jgi:hypothetical protein
MEKDSKIVKKATEQLSERVDALEIALLMVLNSLRNVKSFELEGKEYNLIGKIPESTFETIEKIISKM